MADQSDVEQALAAALAGALYPNGTSHPSLIGATITLMRGWPSEAQIQTAVNAQSVLISVHGEKGMARDTSRYFWDWKGSTGTPTLTASVSGLTVTFAGTNIVNTALAVQCAGVWYLYLTVLGDTPASIATAFDAMIAGSSVSGAVLTLPSGGKSPQARVVLGGNASVEVSRQRMDFRISVWAPTPALRDSVFGFLPGSVGYFCNRLSMPDGSVATWFGQRETGPDDIPARANEWRRDLLATFEFGVSYAVFQQALLLLGITLEGSQAPLGTAGTPSITIDV